MCQGHAQVLFIWLSTFSTALHKNISTARMGVHVLHYRVYGMSNFENKNSYLPVCRNAGEALVGRTPGAMKIVGWCYLFDHTQDDFTFCLG